MAILTFEISDNEAAEISQIIRKKGDTTIANSKDDLSKTKHTSFNQSLKDA